MNPDEVRILVVDDEESLRIVIRNTLKKYHVETADHGRKALEWITTRHYDLILLDIRLPGLDGFTLLDRVAKSENPPPVIMMTAEDTMKNAIEAMKRGAFDYLTKPFDVEELEIVVEKALRERRLEGEVQRLREEVRTLSSDVLVGHSRPMRELHKMIGKLAARDVTVLIQGESGTGKELIARSIHQESPRAEEPFVAVNVAAIPKDLLESELFGYMRGAFTGASEDHAGYFEKAGRGSLFLDEVGDMPLPLQAKILRVLQEREVARLGQTSPRQVSCRVIAATHQNLEKMVKEKRFREDLYYRLNVVPLQVPPLRDRGGDVELLADHFLEKFCAELGGGRKALSAEAMRSLRKHVWPGNVRELENIIKRAIVLSPGQTLREEDVAPFLSERLPVDVQELDFEEWMIRRLEVFLSKREDNLYEAVLRKVEKPLLELVMRKAGNNQVRAARMLGINRNTLYKKLKELDLLRGASIHK